MRGWGKCPHLRGLTCGKIATPLGVLLGGSTSRANAINGSGLIVGQADVGGLSHAVVFSGGAWMDLGAPSGPFGADPRTYQSSAATAVSNVGQIEPLTYLLVCRPVRD